MEEGFDLAFKGVEGVHNNTRAHRLVGRFSTAQMREREMAERFSVHSSALGSREQAIRRSGRFVGEMVPIQLIYCRKLFHD